MRNDRMRGLKSPALLTAATALLALTAACGSDAATPQQAPVLGAAGSGALPPSTPVATPGATPGSVGTGVPGATPGATPGAIPGGTPAAPDAPGSTPVAADDILPCAVTNVMKDSCQGCHGAKPIGGAPMPLMTYSDFHKPASTAPTKKVYQVVQERINDMMRPMPPMGELTVTNKAAVNTWLTAGAIKGTAADATCAPSTPAVPPTGAGPVDGERGPIVPKAGWQCWDFTTHQSTTTVDAVPYDVGGDGEHYEQFYFDVPWEADQVAVAYGTKIDNAAVLHHWLLFATDEGDAHGFHKTSPLPTLIGTNPVLLAGWAVGGPNNISPPDVGYELPQPGKKINVQWHFYNSTGMPQKDASAVQICTVPKSTVKNVGGVTWLGTEDLGGNVWTFGAGMPAHKESTFTTSCTPGRRGMDAASPIHILGFEPHMHRIGKHMKTDVKKLDGSIVNIFDKPFSFGNETHYYSSYDLMPGEQLITSCSFNNDNDFGVPFGESSDTEMCYQFTFAYPAHALSNGAASLLGVTDTCW